MEQATRQLQAVLPAPHKRYSALSTVAKSLAATLVIAVIVSTASFYSGNPLWATQTSGDSISDAQKDERLHAFSALGTLGLSAIADADVPQAVESMKLAEPSKKALLFDVTAVASTETLPSGAASELAAAAGPSKNTVQSQTPDIQPGLGAASVSKGPIPVPTRKHPMRLAWVTLWDTDMEDGDAVRIDSQGYTRTIALTKQPITFAIPVPVDGVVKVTGIRDGEGGGITVGVASGASKAVLPIMSTGQVLNLRVRVN